jgi:predicted RNase H-like HicB family nuclease
MAEQERSFVAVYERDDHSDAWLVRIEGLEGCHSYGRTRAQGRDRIEEALALWLDREPGELNIEHR